MKILILGGNGMLGHKLAERLKKDFEVWATFRNSKVIKEYPRVFQNVNTLGGVDIENFQMVNGIIKTLRPDFIINAIGVIKQLPTAKNVVKTLSINAIFPHLLAEAVAETDIRIINISTDCVFCGTKGNYVEDDLPDATDIYGKSKFLGEITGPRNLTLRTSIIGHELGTAHSLVEWFFSQKGKTVKGFRKAIFSGFPTVILAEILKDIINRHPTLEGLYHVSSEPIGKFELLNLVKNSYNLDIQIEPDEDFVIDRSLNSEKFRIKTGFQSPDWPEMIEKMALDNAGS